MAAWQNFLDNFSRQAEFQAQKQGEQIQAEIDYYNSPEGQRAAQIGGGIMAGLLPIPGSKLLGASRAAKPIIDKMYGAGGRDMVNQGIRNVGSKLPGSSGARVGSDAIGRAPLPVSKAPVQTARGPRGPINVEQPTQLPLRLGGGARNTGGVSETDKAMIDFIKPTVKSDLNRLRSEGPFYPLKAKNVPEALTKATLNRGRPYPGPHLTAQEGSKKLVPLRKTGKAREASWYQDPKTGDLYQYHYGTGSLARGFYKRGANAQDTPKYARRAQQEFNKPKPEGIMNTPPARSQMEQVGAAKRLEQQTNRQKFLEDAIRLDQSKIKAGEAPSKDYNRLLEEYSRLIESLK